MLQPSINGIRILQWIEIMVPNVNQLQFCLAISGSLFACSAGNLAEKTKAPVPNGTGALHYLSK
jgi:hypothetical protein